MPLDLATAKMHLKDTMDAAFSKTPGTRRARVDMARRCCCLIPTAPRDNVALVLWATDYARNWNGAQS